MALSLSDEHRSLSGSVRDVLADRGATADARAALDGTLLGPPRFWSDACQLGWLGLHVREADGGEGAGLLEAAIVLEQLGASVAPGGALASMIASAALPAGSPHLPGLAAGTTTAAIGLCGDWSLDADSTLDARSVSGTATVLGPPDAALLLLKVGDDVAVVSGPALTPVKGCFDPALPLQQVTARRQPVQVLVGAARRLQRLGWLLASAEAAGGMGACLQAAVSYVKVREQFGRPVGSFQAVKHACADLLVLTELATAAVWDAARSDTDSDEALLNAAVAATTTLPAYVTVAQKNIQLHGGVGYTWEHDAHLYLRRATALAAFFGPTETAAWAVHGLRTAGVERQANMDLGPEAEQFREQARTFLQTYRATAPEQRQMVAARAGYVVPHWPRPYGRGAGPIEQLVLDKELQELPQRTLGLGEWVLPTILQHGTDEQRRRWLQPSIEGEIRWCQLFSEPGAGSDAAAVTTRAKRTDGGWLVTGQKVWTSDAGNCQVGLATIRTDQDAGKHAGITAMVIDLAAAGVEVRPLREITGEAMFNEVFLDEVFVPDGDVVGAVGAGWKVARATLANERLSIGGHPITLRSAALLELVRRHPPVDDGVLREIGVLLAEGQAIAALNLQSVERALTGAEPGPEGGIAKVVDSEHAQRVVNLGMRIAGLAGVLGAELDWPHDFLFTRCLTIAGGTSEIVRTQIAERILGLPREVLG